MSENSADGSPVEITQRVEPFAAYRGRVWRNFWMIGLEAVEIGDLLSPENHSRVFELLPEDGIPTHVSDARGATTLLMSVPEAHLRLFDVGEWRIGHWLEDSCLVFSLVIGESPAMDAQVAFEESASPVECQFLFEIGDPESLFEAIQLTEKDALQLYGVTHTEEGLMLTLKGSVDLPVEFREGIRRDLLLLLEGTSGAGVETSKKR